MSKRVQYSEARIAECVVDWLSAGGMDVYQEVQVSRMGPIADIVATVANRVWIIEVKTSFGLGVMAQADHWRRLGLAHWVSIAIPRGLRCTRGKALGWSVLRDRGIGIIEVDSHGYSGTDGEYLITEPVQARLFRHARCNVVLDILEAEHKTFAKAGTQSSARWTPFRRTCQRIREYVLANQGCTLKAVIESTEHHYSSYTSARSSMRGWIEGGIVKGLRIERDGRTVLLYADSQDDNGGGNG